MKCVFISSRHEFSVQYLSPTVVEIGAQGLLVEGSRGPQQFSLHEGLPVVFRQRETAVFLPSELDAKQRQALYEEFCTANPRVAD